MTERTLVLVKPDGVQRGLVGEIIARFEREGLKLVALKTLSLSRELAEKHYAAHRGKPFYDNLLAFITSGPVVALVLEGPEAISHVRKMMGATNPADAESGSIRGDLATDTTRNLVHGSDSAATAREEIANFFSDNEIVAHTHDFAYGETGSSGA